MGTKPKQKTREPEPVVTHDENEIVVRIRRRRARPDWSAPRVIAWAVTAVLGDPALLLVPLLIVAAVVLAVLGIGAAGRAEAIVPSLTAPPADAFQDVGVISLAHHSGAAAWSARAAFAVFRALSFALVGAMALLRSRGATPDPATAARRVGRRAHSVLAVGALSFGFGLLIAQEATLDASRDAGTASTALFVGMLFFPGAILAAVDGAGVFRSLARSARWVVRKPLGHLAIVLVYAAALGGLYRLATFGALDRPRALPLTLYAFAGGLLTAIATAALARRHTLLYAR